MDGNGGLPLEAEYDQSLQVVTASRILSVDEHADPVLRAQAETEARAAVEAFMSGQRLDYKDLPSTIWLAVRPLSGGPPTSHHVEFRARVRKVDESNT